MAVDLREAIHLYQKGRCDEAQALCLRALDLNPADGAACHLLGRIALRMGRADEAVRWIGKAVALFPASADYRMDLGAVLAMSGRAAEALPHLREALRIKPDAPELHNNIGNVLDELGRCAEAIVAYRQGIRLRPGYAEAHYNLGSTLHKLGRLTESAASYREALRLQPHYPKALNNLGNVLADLGDLDGTLATYRRLREAQPAEPMPGSALLYALHYHPDYDAAALYREHVEWARRHAEPLRPHIRPHGNDRSPDRRLRVGYVSPDFRDHTVPRFIGAALERHDRERFEIICYSDARQPDATTARLRALGHAWRETARLSDEDLERLVREDRIDILVDLRGHAAGNRMMLFARKPAPVQATMVGYFDTTGLATMDWRVTDEWMDPPGETECYHTERLARLPGSCWCYRPDDDAPPVAAEPPAVRNRYVTFGSLNKLIKVTRPCAELWSAVIEAVPGSRLLLSVPADAFAATRHRLAEFGLAAERVELVDKTASRADYLGRYNRVDVALDTYPFNGITTTCDALWMGVAVVSLSGATSVSRAGRSILAAAGLSEYATCSAERFVGAAVELAGDVARLCATRAGLRRRLASSRLTDGPQFTCDLERAYRAMWREWRERLGPSG